MKLKTKQTHNKKIRIEEIDNEKVKNVKTEINCDKNSFKVELKYEGGLGLGYDGCGTHTHKD
ncbi:MAG: hypothetical protein PHD96_01215 [Candidatus Pacebacteria bacterium]|jgi:hypothetical protein|nr:hypothetical protein [Candidatus Paceibacterota bacterium]